MDRLIGSGKFGKVYNAVEKATQEEVVVKVIERSGLCEAHLEFLENERHLLKVCGDHPHIVKLLDVCEDRKRLYLIQERLRGGTLTRYIIEQKPLEEVRVKEIIC